MKNKEISEIKRIFLTRLEVLENILNVAEKHFADMDAMMLERLAPDMFPLGDQIAVACSQALGFAQWCAGEPVVNVEKGIASIMLARSTILATKERVAGTTVGDEKLDEIKHIGLGPDYHCDLPARLYVNDYLMPNFYFHITTAYAILRSLGAPVGKADFLTYLGPYIKENVNA